MRPIVHEIRGSLDRTSAFPYKLKQKKTYDRPSPFSLAKTVMIGSLVRWQETM